MQERASDLLISIALFVVAAFWVWKHMKGTPKKLGPAIGPALPRIGRRALQKDYLGFAGAVLSRLL
jgi:hypothetical protein